VEAFRSHLAVNRGAAASTQNQAFNALLFLYRDALKQELGPLADVRRAKRPARLPVVLTRAETCALLARLDGRYALMGQPAPRDRMRPWSVRLRVKDVDFDYRQITVREGKGQKDRVILHRMG